VGTSPENDDLRAGGAHFERCCLAPGPSGRLSFDGRHSGAYPLEGDTDWFVLPHAHDLPAGLCEKSVGLAIAIACPRDLVAPPIPVVFRPRHMFGASMPEATVDEDGNSETREHDVCTPPRAGQRRMNTEPQTLTVESAS
jgi:hypothetical protein